MSYETFSELLDWQWRGYDANHRNRHNLLIHIIAVPLFWIGAVNFVVPLVFAGLIHALGGAILMGVALFLQAKGHEMEARPPEPFRDARDFARRLLAEQFVTFPRFVLTGGWWRNFNAAG
ncbi:MAG TPA: terminase [Nevskia sp.]|nr:terminase [Nevskia sp.]